MTSNLLLSRKLCIMIILTTALLAAPLTTGITIKNALAQSQTDNDRQVQELLQRNYEDRLANYERCANSVEQNNERIRSMNSRYDLDTPLLDLLSTCGEPPEPPAGVSPPLNASTTATTTPSPASNQTGERVFTANETLDNLSQPGTATTPITNASGNASLPVIGSTEEGDLRVVFDTFIVPGSSSEFGTYEPHQSNTFSADETLEWYVEVVGLTNQPSPVDEFENTQYLTDVSGSFTISDEEGNVRESFSEEDLGFLGAETSDTQVPQMSLVFTYTPGVPPELDGGDYEMTFTITDNLSGQRVNVVKDIIISGGGGGPGGTEGGAGGGGGAGGETGTAPTTPPSESAGQASSTPGPFAPSEPTGNETTTEDLSTAEEDRAGLPSPTSNQSLQNFSAYSSPSLGIEFLYPTLWINVTQLIGNSTANIQFISPPENQDESGAIITVSVVKLLNTTTTLEDYVALNEQILNLTTMNYNIIESQNTVLAGSPSIRKVFTMTTVLPNANGTLTNINQKGIQMHGIQGSKAYTISLITEESKHDTLLPVFQRMADSFEVTSQEFTISPISETTKEQTSSLFSRLSYSLNQLQMHTLDKPEQILGSANIITVQASSEYDPFDPEQIRERVQGLKDRALEASFFSGGALTLIDMFGAGVFEATFTTLKSPFWVSATLSSLAVIFIASMLMYFLLNYTSICYSEGGGFVVGILCAQVRGLETLREVLGHLFIPSN